MKYLKIKAFLFITFLSLLTSCLKENEMTVINPENSNPVIEFANTGNNFAVAASRYPNFYIDLGSLDEGSSAKFNINIRYAGSGAAPEDITVNIGLDNDALALFNTQNGRNYKVPPTSVFEIPSSAVIKKGTEQVTVEATINRSADYSFDDAYALPLAISSVSSGHTTSLNFGKAVYSFGVRNSYDGVYRVRGFAFRADPTSPLQGPVGPVERGMATTGATSIQWQSTVPWANGGNSNLPGGYEPIITLDEATNKVTLSSSGGFISPNPNYDNRYDPATKTFYISFTWGGGPSSRLHTDTLVYLRAR